MSLSRTIRFDPVRLVAGFVLTPQPAFTSGVGDSEWLRVEVWGSCGVWESDETVGNFGVDNLSLGQKSWPTSVIFSSADFSVCCILHLHYVKRECTFLLELICIPLALVVKENYGFLIHNCDGEEWQCF